MDAHMGTRNYSCADKSVPAASFVTTALALVRSCLISPLATLPRLARRTRLAGALYARLFSLGRQYGGSEDASPGLTPAAATC
eukprot:1191457-Pleurochrysis_carterae.AAC.3